MSRRYTSYHFIKLTLLCCIYSLGNLANGAGPPIVSRAQWGARRPVATTPLDSNLPYVIIHHTDTPPCNSPTACARRVRSIQNHHMNTNRWWDIGYNFLIGGDGTIYEGRGWRNMGAHAPGSNSKSIGVAFIGRFGSSPPTGTARNKAKQLIQHGINIGKLRSSVTVKGHRDVGSTTCPGSALYRLLSTLQP